MSRPPLVLVMGVAGCGKSTVGRRLARRLGVPFLEGDDFHPPANRAKMAAGQALTDRDRWPWLGRLHRELLRHRRRGAVLACSALKEVYRRRLAGRLPVRIVYLRLLPGTAARRLAARREHFFPGSLLASQFAALQPPRCALILGSAPVDPAALARRLAWSPAPSHARQRRGPMT